MTTKRILIAIIVLLGWGLAIYLAARWLAPAPAYQPTAPLEALPAASTTPLSAFDQQVIEQLRQATSTIFDPGVVMPSAAQILNDLRRPLPGPPLSEQQKQKILNDLRK